MSLISNTLMSGLADRIAQQAGVYKTGLNNGLGGTKYYSLIHQLVPSNGNFDVEGDLITSANTVDSNTISGTMFKSVFNTFVGDLDSHVLGENATSFDAYLNISGLNLHPDFDDVWFRCRGTHLDARNVFFSDDNMEVAYYSVTGSGTGTFTAGTAVGTGTGKTTPTNHAAAKFILVPVADVTGTVQVNVQLTREQPTDGLQADSVNIRVLSSATSGTHFAIKNWNLSGLDNTNTYLNVTNILAAGGASGNSFRVIALREREIGLQ